MYRKIKCIQNHIANYSKGDQKLTILINTSFASVQITYVEVNLLAVAPTQK